MSKVRQAEVVRKRNAELSQQNADLKKKLDEIQQDLFEMIEHDNNSKVKKIVDDLESIKYDWLRLIRELDEKREQYDNLINDLRIIKEIMTKRGFKLPWYQKFLDQLPK